MAEPSATVLVVEDEESFIEALTVANGKVYLRIAQEGGKGLAKVDYSGRNNLRVVQIDAQTELVIAADIAGRLRISRARVSVLANRSDFPRPVGRLGRSEVWRWATVERWARATCRLNSAA